LIEAWKLAKAKEPQLFKDLKLAVVGGSVFTDKYVTQLEQLAGSDKSIVMTGFQSGDSLQALFAGSRFAVHPSTNEGLSLTVLEAMSYGKAVIAADIPENQELVGEYGLTFSPNEAEDLADKLIALVQDPMLAAGLGHVARIHVEEAFNWDDIAKDTLKTYAGKGLAPTAVLATE
jgi:glycosyltransferase involved in cell wall biosynthesis